MSTTKIFQILIVQSDAESSTDLSVLLSKKGYEVRLAINVQIAFDILKFDTPDLLIVDIDMSVNEAFELCRWVKLDDDLNVVPVVFLSKYSNPDTKKQAFIAGVNDFIVKPVVDLELYTCIETHLNKCNLSAEKDNQLVKFKLLNEQQAKKIVTLKSTVSKLEEDAFKIQQQKNVVDGMFIGLQREIDLRIKNEEALKDSEERFHLLFNNVRLCLQTLNAEGKFVDVNQQWLDAFGYQRNEIIGREFVDILVPSEREHFISQFPKLLDKGYIHCEFEMMHKNGTPIFVSIEAKTEKNIDGLFKQIHCFIHDLADSKEISEVLRKNREDFKELFDKAPVGYHEVDIEGKIVRINVTELAMLGYSLSDVVGRCFCMFDADEQISHQMLIDTIEGNQPLKSSYETNYKRKDGTIFPVLITDCLLYDHEGKVLGIRTTVQDISELMKAEQEVLISHLMLKSSLESASDMIILSIDRDYNYLYFNNCHKGVMLDAYDVDICVGKNLLNCISDDEDRLKSKINYDRALAGESHITIEEYGTVNRNYFETRYNPILNDKKEIVGATAFSANVTQQKQTEINLKKSREDFKDLFDNAPIGYHEIDAEGKIVRMNDTELQMLGYTSDEVIGKDFGLLITKVKESREAIAAKLKGDNRPIDFFERNFHTKDGKEIPVLLKDKILKSDDGRITGIRTTVQDVTEQKRIEEELKENERELRGLFDVSPVPMAILRDQKILHMNPVAIKLFGATKLSELFDKSIFDFIHPDFHEVTKENVELLLKNGSLSIEEQQYISLDGEVIDVETQAKTIRYEKKSATLVLIKDITEQKKTERALCESEYKYRNFFEIVQDIYFETRLDGTILEVSPSILIASKGFYTRESLIGKSIEVFYQNITEREEFMRILLQEGKVNDFQVEINSLNGFKVMSSVTAGLRYDAAGKPDRIVGSIRDISERMKHESALKLSEDKFKKAFMTSPDALAISCIDDGKYLSINEGMTKIIGYTEDEMINKTSIELNIWVHPADRELLLKGLKKDGLVTNISTEFRGKNGKIVYGLMSGTLIEIDGVMRLLSITRDITDIRNSELALQRSEQRFKELFEGAPDAMFLVDVENRKIIDANKSACRLFKRDKDKLIGLYQYQLHPDRFKNFSLESFQLHVAQSGGHGHTSPVESVIKCSDGAEVPVEILAQTVKTNDRDMMLGTFRDISIRKNSELVIKENADLINQILQESTNFIDSSEVEIDYNKLCLSVNAISGAKFTAFNLLESNGKVHRTVGFSGIHDIVHSIKKHLGFDLFRKKWTIEFDQNKRIKDNAITKFESLTDFTSHVFPKSITFVLEKLYHLGDVYLVKTLRNKKLIGEFTLFFEKGKTLKNLEILELYTNQVAIYIDRSHTEIALRESELQLRNVISNTPIPLMVHAEDGEVVLLNNSWIDITGYSKQEIPTTQIWAQKAFKDISGEISRNIFDLFKLTKKYHDGEFEVVTKTGNMRIWDFVSAPLGMMPDGRKLVISMATDVTERKVSEDKLQKSEHMLQTILDHFPGIIFWKDVDSRYMGSNQAFARGTGLDSYKDIIGKSDFDFPWHNTEAAKYRSDDLEVINTGKSKLNIIEEQHLVDGKVLWLDTSKVPLVDVNDTVIGVIGVSNDITERVKAEEALRESEENFSTLFSAMTEVVTLYELVFDEKDNAVNYRIVNCNKAFADVFGVERENAIGQLATDVYPDQSILNSEVFVNVATTGLSDEYSTYYKPLDKYFITSVVSPRKNWFATIVKDVSELLTNQEEINVKNKELENFIYITSHDLRSPLVNIQGFSQRLNNQIVDLHKSVGQLVDVKEHSNFDKVLATDIPKSLNFILTNVKKMDTLINGLLQVSRTGRAIMQVQLIDMNKLLKIIIANHSYQLTELNAEVKVNFLKDCFGDENQINQLFSNIISNAIKYRDVNKELKIEISSETTFNKVIYSVKDNGVGIKPNHVEKIWDVFYRVDATLPIVGDGLGLSLAKRIVERNKGKVWVESEIGIGSTFFIELQNKNFSDS